VRARLISQASGDKFSFICDHKMAVRIEPVIVRANGVILDKDVRSYGVVMVVQKK